MKRKNKFMTAILSKEEWQHIKEAMEYYEDMCEKNYNFQIPSVRKLWRKSYHIAHHFNSISVDSIEELADKIERERRKKSRDKPKQKASRNLANEPNS